MYSSNFDHFSFHHNFFTSSQDRTQHPVQNRPIMSAIIRSMHYPSRILMSIIFIVSGSGKLSSIKDTQAYMEAYGVPGSLIYPAAAFELISGALLLLGLHIELVGWLLSGWCLLTGVIFHRQWGGDDGQMQLMMFLKNLVMAGGFLVVVEREHRKL
jgi:putative oxidoreductase